MAHQKNIEPLVFDSNFFVGLFNVDDTLHQRAINLVNLIAERRVIISNLLFAEVITVLAQRSDWQLAAEVGNYLLSSDLIQIIYLDELLQRRAWEIFIKANNKNISFVDCSTMALMEAEGIHELVTFDVTDFKKLQKIYRFQVIKSL